MKSKTPAPSPPAATITAEQLADLTGLSKRRLYQLAEEKKLPAADAGKFPMLETIRQLFAYFQRDGEQLSREKLLRATAERKSAERRERAEARTEDDTWLTWDHAFSNLSALLSRLEQIPSKARSEAGLNDSQAAILQRMIDHARTDASEELKKPATLTDSSKEGK